MKRTFEDEFEDEEESSAEEANNLEGTTIEGIFKLAGSYNLSNEEKSQIIKNTLQTNPALIEDSSQGINIIHKLALVGLNNLVKEMVSQNKKLINTPANDGLTLIHFAAYAGNLELIAWLIETDPHLIKAANMHSKTALHCAASHGHTAAAKLLIEKGAEINESTLLNGDDLGDNFDIAQHFDGFTPLLYAAYYGHTAMARLLIENGATIDSEAWERDALYHAAFRGHAEVAKLLIEKAIEKGIDVKLTGHEGDNVLHCAAAWGDTEVAKLLIEKKGIEVDVDYCGTTPLHYAASRGRIEMVELLIEKGADVKLKENERGFTALHCAVSKTQDISLYPYTSNPTNINAWNIKDTSSNQYSACSISARNPNGYKAIIERLIKHGADIDAKDNDGFSPLHFAALLGYKDVVDLLIERGADINAKDDNGVSPLHFAAAFGYKDIVDLLIERSADFNAKDSNGFSPLHCADTKGHKDIVKTLIKSKDSMDKRHENEKLMAENIILKEQISSLSTKNSSLEKLLESFLHNKPHGEGEEVAENILPVGETYDNNTMGDFSS